MEAVSQRLLVKAALFHMAQCSDFYSLYVILVLCFCTITPAKSGSDMAPAQSTALWTAIALIQLWAYDCNKDFGYQASDAVTLRCKSELAATATDAVPHAHAQEVSTDGDGEGDKVDRVDEEGGTPPLPPPPPPPPQTMPRLRPRPHPRSRPRQLNAGAEPDGVASFSEDFDALQAGVWNALCEISSRCSSILLLLAVADAVNLHLAAFAPAALATVVGFCCALPYSTACLARGRNAEVAERARHRIRVVYACALITYKLSMALAMLPALVTTLTVPACMEPSAGFVSDATTDTTRACTVTAGADSAGRFGRAGVLFPFFWGLYVTMSVASFSLYCAYLAMPWRKKPAAISS